MKNLIRNFKRDLEIAIKNDIRRNSENASRLAFIGFLLTGYIFSRPFMVYYHGYKERLNKIEDLKQDEKFVL
jgi:hypothetical protein